MAFDRNNPTQLAELVAELTNDPLGMGYGTTSTTQKLNLLNDASKNLGGETTVQKLTTGLLLSVMVPADLDAQQVGDGERRYVEAFLGRDFGTDIDDYKPKIRSAFKVNSATVAAIDALVRTLSRSEVLWGEGTTISKSDILAASGA